MIARYPNNARFFTLIAVTQAGTIAGAFAVVDAWVLTRAQNKRLAGREKVPMLRYVTRHKRFAEALVAAHSWMGEVSDGHL